MAMTVAVPLALAESSDGAIIKYTHPETIQADYGTQETVTITFSGIPMNIWEAFYVNMAIGEGTYTDNFPSWIQEDFVNDNVTVTIQPGHKVDTVFWMEVAGGGDRYVIEFRLIVAEEKAPDWGGELPPDPEPETPDDEKIPIPIKGVYDFLYEFFSNAELLLVLGGGLIGVALAFRWIRGRSA